MNAAVPSPIVLVVPREAAGARLDRFLASALASLTNAPSRAELQRWIEHERVLVNGVPRKAADKLREGARVRVSPEPPQRATVQPESGVAFDVMYVDDHVVVVNKPPGLVVHPARGHDTGTLVHGLLGLGLFRLEDLEGEADPAHARPGIVHRLDKGTSGVMVVARTANARERLKEQFQVHSIERRYEAICVGLVVAQTFDTLHGRHPRDRLRFTTRVREGKRAVTHVSVIEALGSVATHVSCQLETGRTHQIRVHLAESGNAVIGDPLYGKPPKSPTVRSVAERLGHQALHARVLGFRHPANGEPMRFEARPPADFALALAALRAIP